MLWVWARPETITHQVHTTSLWAVTAALIWLCPPTCKLGFCAEAYPTLSSWHMISFPPAVWRPHTAVSSGLICCTFQRTVPFKRSVRHSALGSVIVSQLISSPGDLAFPACISQPSCCLSYCKCFGLTLNHLQNVWLTPALKWELEVAV